MAAKCVEDLKAAVDAVKAEYANDPKWSEAISKAEDALKAAESAEAPAPESPGKASANEVHNEVKPESPEDEKKESPIEENSESKSEEEQEHPKDMKGAAKIALLMLRKK
ncbi:MAG: hypothetical protein EBT03_09205 [Betaproteobacteria bacterium]|nr:hypothetical protein [Betaproteobacteria bacterium]NCA17272.1 hypothetical protein [Betaproteobacteria bacterium]